MFKTLLVFTLCLPLFAQAQSQCNLASLTGSWEKTVDHSDAWKYQSRQEVIWHFDQELMNITSSLIDSTESPYYSLKVIYETKFSADGCTISITPITRQIMADRSPGESTPSIKHDAEKILAGKRASVYHVVAADSEKLTLQCTENCQFENADGMVELQHTGK